MSEALNKLLDSLNRRIENDIKEGLPVDTVDWRTEIGLLISVNDAQLIVKEMEAKYPNG